VQERYQPENSVDHYTNPKIHHHSYDDNTIDQTAFSHTQGPPNFCQFSVAGMSPTGYRKTKHRPDTAAVVAAHHVNEQVNLTLPLRNYVTNPVSAGGVTGITGTLSTTTAGVSVTQASSGYPNLGAGSSAANSTDYVLQIAPAFIRGTHIDLVLGVSANEGTTTLLYSQSTGTPSTTILQSQNFNGVAPGTLPAGWSAAHGAGSSTVPWTTNNTFKGTTSNAAFHVNANDGVPGP
jgi:hypothetical protein